MNTPVSLMDDQMVDMSFITQLTGLTDKWFLQAHQGWCLSCPHQTGP